jgi:TolB-like protein
VIGTEVYDRKPPYHPSQDSIVRTEARRLRTKLKEYYESEGKDNPIFIYFRPGSYIPVFRSKVSAAGQEIAAASSAEDVFVEGAGITVAVIPFLDASGQPLSAKYAQGITDELVHEIMQCEGCRVVATSSIAQLAPHVSDIPALAQKLGVQIVFEGSVRVEGSRVRVTSRMVNLYRAGAVCFGSRQPCASSAIHRPDLRGIGGSRNVGGVPHITKGGSASRRGS